MARGSSGRGARVVGARSAARVAASRRHTSSSVSTRCEMTNPIAVSQPAALDQTRALTESDADRMLTRLSAGRSASGIAPILAAPS
eukprot:6992969-Prymnesium_polylepis.1